MKAALSIGVVAAGVWAALAGCDRPGPPRDAASAGPGPARGRTESAPAATTRGLATAGPAARLRHWVLDPPVDEGERGAATVRLVCLAPSVTELCCALGLREQLVGRTRFCDYPPGIESLPALGALDDTNAEALLALRPDLVLVSGTSRAITERLERLNLRFESLPDRSLADVFAAIDRLGALTGRRRTAARLAAGLRAELEQVAHQYARVPRARVLLLLAALPDPPAPPFVAGPGSFHDGLLRLAGHRNVADAGTRAFGPLSLEAIVRADPDVIVELDADGRSRAGGDAEAVRLWSQLGPLRAVRAQRVHVLTGKHHHLPGPRLAQSFAELCRAIAGPPDE